MISTLLVLTSLANPYGLAGCGNCCKNAFRQPECQCHTCGPDFIEPQQPDCAEECRVTFKDTGERACDLPCVIRYTRNMKAEKEPVKEEKKPTPSPIIPIVKVIYAESFSNVTRIIDLEMKTVCYIVYRSSVGTSISCLPMR